MTTVKPIVSLVMGASVNNQQLLEGTDLFFECNVQVSILIYISLHFY